MRDIRRLGPGFFAFTVEVHGDLYSSGVLFPDGCTDPEFTQVRPLIAGQFDLLNAVSADVLHESVAAFLTASGDAERFAGCGLVSVSAHVADAADPDPYLSLAYGDDGVYLSARFCDGVISEVELNLP
jgi:hypothetical protein